MRMLMHRISSLLQHLVYSRPQSILLTLLRIRQRLNIPQQP